MASQARSLDEMAQQGILNLPIGSRFSFTELPQALSELDRGAIAGKAVVVVGDDS